MAITWACFPRKQAPVAKHSATFHKPSRIYRSSAQRSISIELSAEEPRTSRVDFARRDNMLGYSPVMLIVPTPRVIARTARPRPTQVVLVEATAGALCTALCVALLLRVLADTAPRMPIIYWVLAILLGIVLSDFMSGFLHWFFDTFFEETTPF